VAIPKEPPQTAARSTEVVWKTPTLPRLGLYWHTPASSLKTKDGAVQTVLAEYLAGSTSPLYKSLVLEQQLAERLGPSFTDHRDPNLFGVEARFKDEARRASIVAAIREAAQAVAEGKVEAQRLTDIKDHLRYGLVMGLETQDDVAVTLAWNAGILGAPDAVETMYQQLATVTAKDLTDFAKKHLTEQNLTTLVFTVDAGGAK
jgi:zinc protease